MGVEQAVVARKHLDMQNDFLSRLSPNLLTEGMLLLLLLHSSTVAMCQNPRGISGAKEQRKVTSLCILGSVSVNLMWLK